MLQEGQLKDIPIDIILKMLDEQERQGNKRDVRVFQALKVANNYGGGFDWGDVKDDGALGHALHVNNPDIFYRHYPKQQAKLKVGDFLPGSGYDFTDAYSGYKGSGFSNSSGTTYTISEVTGHYYKVQSSHYKDEYYIKIEDVDKNVPMMHLSVVGANGGVLFTTSEPSIVWESNPSQIKNKTTMKKYNIKGQKELELIKRLLELGGYSTSYDIIQDYDKDGFLYKLLQKYNLVEATTKDVVEEQVFNIPFKVTVKDGKAYHASGEDITAYVKELITRFTDSTISTNVGTRAVFIDEVTFIQTGCEKVQTKLSDWKKIYDALNK